MKLQIIACLSAMVKEKFGADVWQEVLRLSDMDDNEKYMLHISGMDIDDKKAMEIVHNTCRALNITIEQAAGAFGEYWTCVYAPKIYTSYYKRYRSARAFIMGMDDIHEEVTNNIENAHPPRFEIKVLDEDRIRVHYKSKRNMIVFYIGLAKGIAKYFNTPIEVKKLSEEYVEINFRPKRS